MKKIISITNDKINEDKFGRWRANILSFDPSAISFIFLSSLNNILIRNYFIELHLFR